MKNVDEAETRASSVKCTGLNFEKLEKSFKSYVDEIDRGRNLKIIIEKHGFNTHALPENTKEALKAYEHFNHGRYLKRIIEKHGVNTHTFTENMKDA